MNPDEIKTRLAAGQPLSEIRDVADWQENHPKATQTHTPTPWQAPALDEHETLPQPLTTS